MGNLSLSLKHARWLEWCDLTVGQIDLCAKDVFVRPVVEPHGGVRQDRPVLLHRGDGVQRGRGGGGVRRRRLWRDLRRHQLPEIQPGQLPAHRPRQPPAGHQDPQLHPEPFMVN